MINVTSLCNICSLIYGSRIRFYLGLNGTKISFGRLPVYVGQHAAEKVGKIGDVRVKIVANGVQDAAIVGKRAEV